MERKRDLAGLRAFKTHEMAQRPEVAAFFYRTIEEHNILAAISCVMDKAALVRIVDEFVGRSISNYQSLINPYLYASRLIVENLAQEQHRLGLFEPIDFIFDNESEKERVISGWDWFRKSFPPDVRRLICDCPIYRNDQDFMPLQAADLWAWWVRKWHQDGNRDGVKHLDLPWGAKRDIKRLHSVYDEAVLRGWIKEAMYEMPLRIVRPNNSPKQRGIKITMRYDPTCPHKWRV
ncbi:hypothetical protein [Rhodoplanes sp. Z2-YC6860]|uniref:hypothetical protein n=1 Tax=Rhodoplanes sp. Z2-YC6860 TaxID=674703 RepID=UPI00078D3AF3|nr:hypothetical protein [Rhodoplanes sp. Z2-YC6860]AMN39961.1 hypothetical protein RHPLAN_15060 [Rhodoplanes sp. Z2-YC6860]